MSATTPAASDPLHGHYESWSGATDFRATSLNRLVLSLTPRGTPGAPARVLDLGCGSGALTAELLRAGLDVTSQDVSARMVELCRAHLEALGLSGERVRVGGAADIPERHAFDAIIALDVIEHIEDDREALEQIRAALAPSGRLILTVPALSALYGPRDVEVGHYRRYDRAALLAVLDRAGFEVDACRFWNLLGVAPMWLANVRGKRIDESVRYSRSPAHRALNAALRLWFHHVENAVEPPAGLTLLVTARPRR